MGISGFKERIYLFAGVAPRCEWVRARLSAYCQFDLPSSEFRAVERHLNGCAECEAEHKATAKTLELLVRQIAKPGLLSPEAHVDRLFSRIRAQEKSREVFVPTSKHVFCHVPMSRLAVAAATACVVMVVVPAMAYVGAALVGFSNERLLRSSSDPTTGSQSASTETSKTANASASRATTTPKIKIAALQDAGQDTIATARIEKITNDMAARAEVEAMLPHTDAEYEAWARKEYPHIMALYDILTGKPAKAWPNLPEDVQALLAQYAEMANAQSNPLWDGQPVNIPDWAKRLYANTPESDRRTGWRALLIFSGEMFKFDWPKTYHEPNVLPTLDAVQEAALVAGRSDRPEAIFRDIAIAQLPASCPKIVASDNILADEVLRYLAVSSRFTATAQIQECATEVVDILVAIHVTPNQDCTLHDRLQLLTILLHDRDVLLKKVIQG